MPERKFFLGIDQTGAVFRHGRPKPLPACIVKGGEVELFSLPFFTKESLLRFVPEKILKNTFIGLDCVLGLPRNLELSWRDAIRGTLKEPGFGRIHAEHFFQRIGKGTIPRREVELRCKANSVFQNRPFQKNVQTGTYRLWREMAEDPNWFFVPNLPGENKEKRVPVFEGYPSLAWRQLFPVKTRSPKDLPALLRQAWPKLVWKQAQQRLVEKDPNYADSLVLALAVRQYAKAALARDPDPEGWILGAEEL